MQSAFHYALMVTKYTCIHVHVCMTSELQYVCSLNEFTRKMVILFYSSLVIIKTYDKSTTVLCVGIQ